VLDVTVRRAAAWLRLGVCHYCQWQCPLPLLALASLPPPVTVAHWHCDWQWQTDSWGLPGRLPRTFPNDLGPASLWVSQFIRACQWRAWRCTAPARPAAAADWQCGSLLHSHTLL